MNPRGNGIPPELRKDFEEHIRHLNSPEVQENLKYLMWRQDMNDWHDRKLRARPEFWRAVYPKHLYPSHYEKGGALA